MLPATGAEAPEFALTDDSGTSVTRSDLTASGPAVLAFFKQSCPTCQLSFPVWGELARRYGDVVPIVAVTQDEVATSRAWLDERGFAGPVLDDSDGYAVSDAYGIESVPTLVLIADDGTLARTSDGWDRATANAWDLYLAEVAGRPSSGPVSVEGDGRPALKPG